MSQIKINIFRHEFNIIFIPQSVFCNANYSSILKFLFHFSCLLCPVICVIFFFIYIQSLFCILYYLFSTLQSVVCILYNFFLKKISSSLQSEFCMLHISLKLCFVHIYFFSAFNILYSMFCFLYSVICVFVLFSS